VLQSASNKLIGRQLLEPLKPKHTEYAPVSLFAPPSHVKLREYDHDTLV
jgi:hypothetical protein